MSRAMSKGKRGTRNSYTAVTQDMRQAAVRNLHRLGRGACGASGHYRVWCTACGKLFQAISVGSLGWKRKCVVGEKDQICPAAVFGHGEGI